MQGNIKVIKSREWGYTMTIKKLSIEKNGKFEIF